MSTCQHCARTIIHVDGSWVDPEASGDDVVWRETCDSHDTFTAEHEPAHEVMASQLEALHDALRLLDNLTTAKFSMGGDRPVRHALVAFLSDAGYPIGREELRDYGLAS